MPRDLLLAPEAGDRWMVVAAHPDDESFVCGSMIAAAVAAGAAVHVVCCTRGELGESAIELPAGASLAEVREQEVRAAAQIFGATIEILEFLDSGFEGDAPANSLCAVGSEVVAEHLDACMAARRPDVVVVFDGSDGHRDHVVVCQAVHQANHRHGALIAEVVLPNSLMRRWLEEATHCRPDTAYLAIDPASFGRPDADITDVLDHRHLLPLREQAMAIHRSQHTPFEGFSRALTDDFLGIDYVVRIDR
jgi:LmbE family N-acetylglucosaminyl deacetylase